MVPVRIWADGWVPTEYLSRRGTDKGQSTCPGGVVGLTELPTKYLSRRGGPGEKGRQSTCPGGVPTKDKVPVQEGWSD